MSLLAPRLPTTDAPLIRWGRLYGAAPALAIAEAAAEAKGPVIVLTRNSRDAESLSDEITFFAGGKPAVHVFPDLETLPYDSFSAHPDITSARLAALADLPHARAGVWVVAVESTSTSTLAFDPSLELVGTTVKAPTAASFTFRWTTLLGRTSRPAACWQVMPTSTRKTLMSGLFGFASSRPMYALCTPKPCSPLAVLTPALSLVPDPHAASNASASPLPIRLAMCSPGLVTV